MRAECTRFRDDKTCQVECLYQLLAKLMFISQIASNYQNDVLVHRGQVLNRPLILSIYACFTGTTKVAIYGDSTTSTISMFF